MTFPDPSIPQFVQDWTRPKMQLPDSLGGPNIRGFLDVDACLTKAGTVSSFQIQKIVIYNADSTRRIIYSVFDSATSPQNIADMSRYVAWTEKYLRKCTFKVDTSLFESNNSHGTVNVMLLVRLNENKY